MFGGGMVGAFSWLVGVLHMCREPHLPWVGHTVIPVLPPPPPHPSPSLAGNDDGMSALSSTQTGPYYSIFSVPTTGGVGSLASNTEAYYSFTHANVHFIVVNSYDVPRYTVPAPCRWWRGCGSVWAGARAAACSMQARWCMSPPPPALCNHRQLAQLTLSPSPFPSTAPSLPPLPPLPPLGERQAPWPRGSPRTLLWLVPRQASTGSLPSSTTCVTSDSCPCLLSPLVFVDCYVRAECTNVCVDMDTHVYAALVHQGLPQL